MAFPIFVGGVGRCGSTFLMRLLDRHLRIFSFGEAKFIRQEYLHSFLEELPGSDRKQKLIEDFKSFLLDRCYSYTFEHKSSKGVSTSDPEGQLTARGESCPHLHDPGGKTVLQERGDQFGGALGAIGRDR